MSAPGLDLDKDQRFSVLGNNVDLASPATPEIAVEDTVSPALQPTADEILVIKPPFIGRQLTYLQRPLPDPPVIPMPVPEP